MDDSEDDIRKVATSILLEELIEDDESVAASVSGSVSMVNTLTAMATAALEVDEGHNEGQQQEDAAPVDHTHSQQNPADSLLKLYWRRDIPECTTSEFRHFFRMRRSTFEVSAMILPFLLEYKKAVVECPLNSNNL